MRQIIRELKRQAAGELEPEQLKGLIRAGYVYRNGDEHLLTSQGREALAQPGVYPGTDAPRLQDRMHGRGFIWGGNLAPPCTDRCRRRQWSWAGDCLSLPTAAGTPHEHQATAA
jgi:hypothetical protein